MAEPTPATTDPPAPKKRGPKTPEGKARSSMNALKHGLRARRFGLLPGEDPAEWAQHLAELCQSLRPRDPLERKLVEELAAALWYEIRADGLQAETLVEIPPSAPGGSRGADLFEPEHRAALTTAIRYQAMAGNAVRRALRAFLTCREARRDGLLDPAADEICTNDFTPPPGRPLEPAIAAEPAPAAPAEPAPAPPVEADPEKAARAAILAKLQPWEQQAFADRPLELLEQHAAISDPDPTAYEAWRARQPRPPTEPVPLGPEERAAIAHATRHNPDWLKGPYLGFHREPVPKEAFGLDERGVPATGAEPEPTAPVPANEDGPKESPLVALRARVLRLLDRAAPRLFEELDLAEAICALRWPKWPTYRGEIDLWRLERALEGIAIDSPTLHWLGGRELEKACKAAAGRAAAGTGTGARARDLAGEPF